MTTPQDFPTAVAAELRAALARQNRSRRWLAEQTGHSHVTVSRWLNDGQMPLGALLELCDALGISPADIIADYERRRGPSGQPRRRASDFLSAALNGAGALSVALL